MASAAERVDAEVFSRLKSGDVVGIYAALHGEISADGVAEAGMRRGLVIAYPRVVSGERVLRFHQATSNELSDGAYGVPEPCVGAPTVDLSELSVIIVPGLLFDRAGLRLGWGGGYYDATLPMTSALRIGLAFECQLVDALPSEMHDQTVHLIATDKTLHIGASGHRLWIS